MEWSLEAIASSLQLEFEESKLPYGALSDYAPISFKVVFQGIPRVCEPQTIEMKIPRSQNPKELSLSITYEEYSFPTAEE